MTLIPNKSAKNTEKKPVINTNTHLNLFLKGHFDESQLSDIAIYAVGKDGCKSM